MQATVTTTITIASSPERVFEYLADLQYHYLWNPQMLEISPKKKLQLGDTYKTKSRVLGTTIETHNKVIGFKEARELVLENTLGAVTYRARFALKKQNGSTQVRLSVNLSTDRKIYMFSGPVLRQLALRELRTDLESLKVAAENELA